jgi:hypothetical protein
MPGMGWGKPEGHGRPEKTAAAPGRTPRHSQRLTLRACPPVLEVHQFAQEAVVADAWLTAQEPLLQSRELGSSVDEVEQLIRRHEAFRKAAAAWEERFSSLRRLTTVSTPDPDPPPPPPRLPWYEAEAPGLEGDRSLLGSQWVQGWWWWGVWRGADCHL